MKDSITGGCLCGEIRYEVPQGNLSGTYCHCTDCQKATGVAYAFSVPIAPQDFVLSSGDVKSYEKMADSGRKIVRNFCSNCGSMVFTGDMKTSPYIWIKVGTLDNPELVKPIQQIWTSSRQTWSNIDADLPSFEKNPH